MKAPLRPTVYSLLVEHGPLTSTALAEMMSISLTHAGYILNRLAAEGGCEAISQVLQPESRIRSKLWRAVPDWQPHIKPPHIGNTPKIGITAEDRAWMQRQRDIASARRARIAATNEVRGRA